MYNGLIERQCSQKKSLDFYGTTALGKENFQVSKPFFTPAAKLRLHYKLRLGANILKL